jgi:hypothetical protein
MLGFNAKNGELDNFSESEEFDESYLRDEELNDSWSNTAEREQAIEAATIKFVSELTAIRTSLAEQQQLNESFDRLSYNVVEQRQQLQTIARLLEQLAKSLSTENTSKLLQIQKSFSVFAQKLEMFEKAIDSNLHQQQESRSQADEVYQNLNRAWQRLADEIKKQRQILGGIPSWENFAILSIGSGFSAAAFMFLGFKLFLTTSK